MEDFVRYLEEIVEPTIADFEQNARSVRHAFLACVTVFHAVDYLAFPGTSRGTREDFSPSSRIGAVFETAPFVGQRVIRKGLHYGG
jgi:hypothetical protein